MMIVVTVIGVLAAIAIPSFIGYVYRARAAEAVTFLAEIRQRQESYRAEFGQYCDVSGGSWSFTPASIPGVNPVAWPGGANWGQLGAAPDTEIRFQYATIAGAPGTTPPGGLGYDGSDFWFVSEARADLDGDGRNITLESYSASNKIWSSQSKGWE